MSNSADWDVRGRAMVVTGAARGIGFGIAQHLLAKGAKVTLLDRDEEALASAARDLADAGCQAQHITANVANRDEMERALEHVARDCGALDVVFANAGIGGGPGFLDAGGAPCAQGVIDAVPELLWNDVVATNLTGVFNTLRAAARIMKAQRRGKIVITTSVAGRINEPMVGYPYTAAKAGAAHLARHAALELAPYGVQVNCIAPGPVYTTIAGGRLDNPTDRAAFENLTPMRRIGSVSELYGLALLLASDASSYITGAEFVVDGGAALGRRGR